MAMAASCSCTSSVALAHLGLELHSQWIRRGRHSLGSRKLGELSVVSGANLRSCGVSGRFSIGRKSVSVRAVAAGDGEEVEESDRPKTMSSKTRPKTMSSTIQRPSSLDSERRASGSKGKVRSTNLISALMDDIAEFMSPREKGDIRDVVLMSFSFALFIYISQHLVHAYCVLKHTLQPFHHF